MGNLHEKPLSRRDFLKHSSMIAAAIPMIAHSEQTAQAAPAPFNNVVDCHFHLWAADKKRFPLHPEAPYIPPKISTIEQWQKARVGSGVEIGIFVSGEPYQDDLRYVIYCMEKEPVHLRGVALFNPNAKESPRRLAEIVKGRNFVAARVHSYPTHNQAEWNNPNFEAYWAKVGELDLVLQLHMHPEFNWDLERFITKYPDMRVVVDHLGRPRQGNPIDYQVLLDLGSHPNLYIKFSALVDQSAQDPPYDNLKPLLKEIVKRFGPDRIVWGDSYNGDMTTAEYADSITTVSDLLDFMPMEDRRKIFEDNPRRLFKL
jgi:predicted TIM-barrel fold metal-dependent hydrolase